MRTGSGVTLDALARRAHEAGIDQHFVVGTPVDSDTPPVADLPRQCTTEVHFGGELLPHPVVGMSDVMPYATRTFSSLSIAEIDRYRDVWRKSVSKAVANFKPDLIHSNHVWLLSSVIRNVCDVPVLMHCHGTGLRQMTLCPHLRNEVVDGCRRNQAVLALHNEQAGDLRRILGFSDEQVSVVGGGYDDQIFTPDPLIERSSRTIAYAGKLSHAKGVPELLEAVSEMDDVRLHLAGGGDGPEADEIRKRASELGDRVIVHGAVAQPELAAILRGSQVFVLPSFYEGVPLALIEALACGCQLVSTALPGVAGEIAPHIGDAFELVELPELIGADRLADHDRPKLISDLRSAIERALEKGPPVANLSRFTWAGVYRRTRIMWDRLAA